MPARIARVLLLHVCSRESSGATRGPRARGLLAQRKPTSRGTQKNKLRRHSRTQPGTHDPAANPRRHAPPLRCASESGTLLGVGLEQVSRMCISPRDCTSQSKCPSACACPRDVVRATPPTSAAPDVSACKLPYQLSMQTYDQGSQGTPGKLCSKFLFTKIMQSETKEN